MSIAEVKNMDYRIKNVLEKTLNLYTIKNFPRYFNPKVALNHIVETIP